MSSEIFEIKVPATSANLGPGFDSLGIALKLYNTFVFRKRRGDLRINLIDNRSGKEFTLPVKENLVYTAMKKIFNIVDQELTGFELTERVSIPLSRGLGSSASAVIAGLVAANLLLGQPLNNKELIKAAVQLEGHPDNVLPALLGGFIINVITDEGPIYKKIDVKNGLNLLLIIPDFKLATEELRQVLPTEIPYTDAVFNHSRTALLTACLIDGDWEKIKYAMEDRLHQDYRSSLIPGFMEVVRAGYQAGATGVALSGAGPTILVLSRGNEEDIGQAMTAAFGHHGVKADYLITGIDNNGVIIKDLTTNKDNS